MVENWDYPSEFKTYQIIRSQHLPNYNIANLAYDTLAQVQKYLHRKDGIILQFDDYRTNKYLFVITATTHFMNNPAYEVNTFKPSRLVKTWPINDYYSLYLLERNK